MSNSVRGMLSLGAMMLGVALVLSAALPAQPAMSQAGTANISIENRDFARGIGSFVPDTITVKLGDTVKWTNNDANRHTVTSGEPFDSDVGSVFGSPGLFSKREFSYTFLRPGTFDYHCKLHPVMTGVVIVESVPPELSLEPLATSFVVGQSIAVKGHTSLITTEPVEIEVYDPQGKAYLLDRTSVLKDGSFSYSFTALGTSGIGPPRVIAKYFGSIAETTFRLEQQESAGSPVTSRFPKSIISVTATSKTPDYPVTINLKNTISSGIYEFAVTLPGEPASMQAPRGWIAETDGTTIVFSTDNRPIENGKKVAFRVSGESAIGSFSWTVSDNNGEELDTGTTSVRVRR